MGPWELAVAATAAGWLTEATQLLQAHMEDPAPAPRFGLWVRGDADAAQLAADLEGELGPIDWVWVTSLDGATARSIRTAGADWVLEVDRRPSEVRLNLWQVDAGLWAPSEDLPRLAASRAIPGEASAGSGPPAPSNGAGDSPPSTGAERRLFAVSFRVRALAACGPQAILLLGDSRVHALVRASEAGWSRLQPASLDVLERAAHRSRAPAGRVACRRTGRDTFEVAVGHGAFRRGGILQLDLRDRALRWADFVPGIPLSRSESVTLYASTVPGTNRYTETLYRSEARGTRTIDLAPFIDFCGGVDGPWIWVSPSLQAMRDEDPLRVRIGRGLVCTDGGGFGGSSAEPGPEHFGVYDGDGRPVARIELDAPVLAATMPPRPGTAWVAVKRGAGSEILELSWRPRP
jgi:hypothetical protein